MESISSLESTLERKKRLEKCLQAAEPYEDDDPAWNMWDGNCDIDRLMATLAKKALQNYDESGDRNSA